LRFYLVLEGHIEDVNVSACISALRRHLEDQQVELRILGSHPSCLFSNPRLKTVGIVGGEGRMGKWFGEFFRRAGINVLSADLNTEVTAQKCVEKADVILISVPIGETRGVIEKIAPTMREGQLLVDNTSVKGAALEAMLKSVPPGVEVLGMHTIFGPSIVRLEGQNVVLTRTSVSGPLVAELEALLFKCGARVVYASPEGHDRQMAFHQNLEHFTKVVLAEVIRREFKDLRELEKFSSPNSRASLGTMARILNGNTNVLTEIQEYNRAGPELIRVFTEVAQRIARELVEGRSGEFRASLEESVRELDNEALQKFVHGV
jgi:prephenate dehydrogenase